MGIPHLITFLQPYAPREALKNRRVVIDGPGFAHHVYYICMRSTAGARNGFEAAPSYEGLVNTSIAWLEALRRCDVKIDKIYFDGFLPHTKTQTRHNRLALSTSRLSRYHTANPVPCRSTFKSSANAPSSLFGPSALRPSLGTLPPLPFLVPAVLEGLLRSKSYQDVVEVVPGEADLYCAKYVSEKGGLILTGDSDLLVHNLGAEGAVSFFKDIASQINDHSDLSAEIYQPAVIAERLALPASHGLRCLAFEMFMDTHGTFPKLVSKARSAESVCAFPKLFEDFITEYNQLLESFPITVEELSQAIVVLRETDPRISEYILQFPSIALIAAQVPCEQAVDSMHIFLPFILDCPIRTNAWEISSPTRQLAYGLMNLIVPEAERKLTVFEHRRQQNNSNGLELAVPSIAEIPVACKTLSDHLTHIGEKIGFPSEVGFWTAVAVHQELESACLRSKASTIEVLVKRHRRTKDMLQKNLNWEAVHLLGQSHGSYYSFRILKQILRLVIQRGGASIPDEIWSLEQQLKTLPGLTALPSYGDVSVLIKEIDSLQMVQVSREILGLPPLSSESSNQDGASHEKKKRKRETLLLSRLNKPKQSNNPFDLLDVE